MKFTTDKEGILMEIVLKKAGLASTSRSRKLIKSGSVLVDGKTIKMPKTNISSGQIISIDLKKKTTFQRTETKFPFQVLYEDKFFIAFNKPAGFPVRSENRKVRTVVSDIRHWLDTNESSDEFFYINKIDKRESGIILVARDFNIKKAFEPIDEQIKFRYYVVCEGEITQEDMLLKKSFSRNKIGLLYTSSTAKNPYYSEIKTRKMKGTEHYTLLKVESTGHLKNEIRAQLSSIGHPIIGDKRYRSEQNPIRRMGLHLFSLEFLHPETGEWIRVHTSVPKDFMRLSKKRNG